jgi:DNA-binding response OmpR family regulator
MTQQRRPVVLVVDDSEIACEAVKHTLGQAGIEVATLNSPFGFIKTIREIQPDLLLIDVGLGAVHGGKLVDLGRRYAPRTSAILLYSSRDAALLQQDADSSGADGYITKSTTGREFVALVERWIERTTRSRG